MSSRICFRRFLSWVVLLPVALPLATQAQFLYVTNFGRITITGYNGPGDAVVIPETINGMPVTTIAGSAFGGRTNITSVSIPNTVTAIGDFAFGNCLSLRSVTVPDSVTQLGIDIFRTCISLTNAAVGESIASIPHSTFAECRNLRNVTIGHSIGSIGDSAFLECASLSSISMPTNLVLIGAWAFSSCHSLTTVDIPDKVTTIGADAFHDCLNLTNVTIGYSVSGMGNLAFAGCSNLIGVYFRGNAPGVGGPGFTYKQTVYYLPWTTGWGRGFGGSPTALWLPKADTNPSSFGIHNDRFGFAISWASDPVITIEATTDLAAPSWFPLRTFTLTNGSAYFSDPDWASQPRRFYRIRSP